MFKNSWNVKVINPLSTYENIGNLQPMRSFDMFKYTITFIIFLNASQISPKRLTPFESHCHRDPILKALVYDLYALLMDGIGPHTLSYISKWEFDLGKTLD